MSKAEPCSLSIDTTPGWARSVTRVVTLGVVTSHPYSSWAATAPEEAVEVCGDDRPASGRCEFGDKKMSWGWGRIDRLGGRRAEYTPHFEVATRTIRLTDRSIARLRKHRSHYVNHSLLPGLPAPQYSGAPICRSERGFKKHRYGRFLETATRWAPRRAHQARCLSRRPLWLEHPRSAMLAPVPHPTTSVTWSGCCGVPCGVRWCVRDGVVERAVMA